MAQCKWCDKKGFLLSVDEKGLCKRCSYIFSVHIFQVTKIILESQDIITNTKRIEIVVGRTETITEQLDTLLKYEEKGIKTVEPSIDHYRKNSLIVLNGTIVLLTENNIIGKVKLQVEKLKTNHAKINAINKASSKLEESRKLTDEKGENYNQIIEYFDEAEGELKELMNNYL